MSQYIDITGQKFGRLTVTGESMPLIMVGGRKAPMVLCVCDCGKTVVVGKRNLKNGGTKSCGCLSNEIRAERVFVHGLLKNTNNKQPKLYMVWSTMKQRCMNPNKREYRWYGALGIKVCRDWSDNYLQFYNWANANGYKEGLTIERIDYNGNYEPSNCTWIPMKLQNQHKRNSHYITINGKTQILLDWSREIGISYATLLNRIKRNWSDDKLLQKGRKEVQR